MLKESGVKMKNRIISMLMVLTMVLSCVMLPASAAVTYKDWTNVWWLTDTDELTAHPAEYSFTLPGDEVNKDAFGAVPAYQLLDEETVDGKKNYLIMRTGTIVVRSLLANDDTTWYNPESKHSVAYYVDKIWTGEVDSDSEYTVKKDVTGTLLNEKFRDYLLEHEWTIEKSSGAGLAETTITAKAVIPSVSEMDAYSPERLAGFMLATTAQSAMLTRTPRSIKDGKYQGIYLQKYGTNTTPNPATIYVTDSTPRRAWGMFWVSEDFFKNVKISTMGAEVAPVVADLNTVEELYALGYSYEELVAMGKIEAGEVPENVAISVEKAVPGYPVSVVVDGEEADEAVSVMWYVSSTENGEYAPVAGASGNSWAITNACENKYIKAGVNGVMSNAIAVGAGLTQYAQTWWVPAGMPEETPKQYSFKLANPSKTNTKEKFFYQMLDTETVDGEKQYFIIQLGDYATNGQFSRDASNITFDPSVKMSMAGWLNDVWCVSDDPKISEYARSNGGPLNSNGTVMDASLRDYLVKDRMWLTERSGAAGVENDFVTKAAVSILSKNEILKYYNKIGSNDFATSKWTRTPVVQSEQNRVWYLQATGGGEKQYGPFAGVVPTVDANYAIYPVFYLTEDFFKNVKLDVDATGSDVLAEVKAHNTVDELYAIGYTQDELVKMGVLEKVDVVISTEKAVPGYDISVTVDGVLATDDVTWYFADAENGEYTAIENAVGNTWTIENAYANKYVKVKAQGFDSNVIAIGAGLREFNPDLHGGWALPKDMPEESPEEYKFTLANPSNEEFTYHMLETEDVNGQTQYFILQMGRMISNGKMVPNSTDYKFDPTVSKSLADWLNNIWAVSSNPNMSDYYMSNGGVLNNNGTAIDINIRPYLQNHTWLTERSGDLVPNDYTFTGKVSLLSVTEFFEHYKKIGKNDYGTAWFRTSTKSNSGESRFYMLHKEQGVWAKVEGWANVIHYYRPAYYLSEEFFKNVKLESAGAEVAKMVRTTITKEEMLKGSAGYTEEEVTEIFGYGTELTYEENAVIAGTQAVGQRVQASFDGVLEGAMYQWYVADENDGLYERIDGATERSYVIKDADLGRYLAVEIIAFDGEGQLQAPIIGKSDVPVLEEKDLTVVFKASTNGKGSTSASFEIKNKKETTEDVVLILAVYDNSGRFVKANYAEEDIVSGTDTYSVTVDSLDTTKTYVYKAIVWDGFSTMVPLCIVEQF